MDIRRDALVGAARLIDAAFRKATSLNGNPHYVVATHGRIAMTPNVPNAVPGKVELMLEVRSDSDAVLAHFPEQLLASVASELDALQVSGSFVHVSRATPTACHPLVMDAVERAASCLGYATMRLPSGAGHDAVSVAATGPIGMIFIPCLNGRSHCPEEWIEPQQLLDGTRVLYQTILELDRQLACGGEIGCIDERHSVHPGRCLFPDRDLIRAYFDERDRFDGIGRCAVLVVH